MPHAACRVTTIHPVALRTAPDKDAMTTAAAPTDDPDDLVVLVDDAGTAIGSAARTTVHTFDTPLHLAFSAHLRRPDGRFLITRRALSKRTWPGVWTNSACGHLRPGESAPQALHRRVPEELGVTVRDLTPLLPDFRYRAVDASGIVENELCPVFAGVIDEDPRPDADEVCEWAWVEFEDLAAVARTTPRLLSPWFVDQLAELDRISPRPRR